MNKELALALRAPFKAEQVGHLPKVVCKPCSDRNCTAHKASVCRVCKAYLGKHIHIDYVGHAHVTERILNIDPDWSWEPFAVNSQGLPALDDNGGLWIKLTIGGKTMIGYGDAPGKRAAAKELIGDAIRNAAMRFGVALDLWKKEPVAPVSEEQVRAVAPAQSEEERKSELRGQIAAIGRQQKKSDADTATEFHLWTEGRKEIGQASLAELAEYKVHIQRSA